MPSSNGQRPSSTSRNSNGGKSTNSDLVDQVADLVYKMWKRDLRIERERYRTKANPFSRRGGI
jgi:hypothetical protein